jgi:fucose 4-O-acetylase-like acetyltransferase
VSPTKPPRDPYFDNAKMLLVTLVVVGHAWALVRTSTVGAALYDFLYLFHIPAFVMVTGYLSRSFSYSRRNLHRLLTTVVVPYVVFEAALAVFRTRLGGETLQDVFADPHWPMWYLAVLFLWRLATPILKSAPAPLALAVLVCLLGGLTTGDVLDVARAMGLLPFFVIGLTATPERIELLRRPAARIAASAALLVGLGSTWLLSSRFSAEWLYWRSSYAELGAGVLEGAAVRLALLVVCAVLGLSVLALVPTTRLWITGLGSATLVVYLFHGFPVKAAEYAGLRTLASDHPIGAFVLATAAALALALLLAVPPVARRLNLVVDPFGSRRTWARWLGSASRQASPAPR